MNDTVKTIYYQFGGGRAMGMIRGLVTFTDDSLTVHFGGSRKAKACQIALNGSDLYDVSFFDRSANLVQQVSDVFAENLQEVFESFTGLYLSL